jgi:6-phosphogluconolactonase
MHRPELHVFPDAPALTAAAVARWVAACHHAVAKRGRFVVALAGGGTPLAAYRHLAERRDLPWERVLVTWGDERLVPLDHEERNERSAREALLSHVDVPPEHVLGWGEGDDPAMLARAHEERLRGALGDPPRFDLVLLGLGADAHTASLFPGTRSVFSPGIATVSTAPDGGARLTLTPRALSHADEVLVLVSGADKRDALRRTLQRDGDEDALPLTALAPSGAFLVLADAQAAPSPPADGVAVER